MITIKAVLTSPHGEIIIESNDIQKVLASAISIVDMNPKISATITVTNDGKEESSPRLVSE